MDDHQNDIFDRPFDNDVSPHTFREDLTYLSFFHHFSPNNMIFDHQYEDGFFYQQHNHDLSVAHHLPQQQQQLHQHQHQHQLLLTVDSNPTATAAGTVFTEDQITTESSSVNNMAAVSLNGTTCVQVNYGSSSDPSKLLPNNNYNSPPKDHKRIPRKSRSAGKKDRHSKIVTAQGPRDRRMRLSLEIARKFFSLQDMLGVDKASKTVQWLLMKSKPAIKELMNKIGFSQRNKQMKDGYCPTNASSCMSELISELEENAFNQDDLHGMLSKGKTMEPSPKEKIRGSCKAAFHPLARESRAKARARARERTIQKKRSQGLDKSKQCFQVNNSRNPNQFIRPPPKKVEESSPHCDTMKSFTEVVNKVKKPSSESPEHQGINKNHNVDQSILQSFVITRKSSPTSVFNYHKDMGSSSTFQENREIISNAATSSSYYAMHLQPDMQFLGSPTDSPNVCED